MAEDFSNYDMLDKMIANNKKAKSWTVIWVTILCILAGVVWWMAYDISKKKKVIVTQQLALQTQEEFLETKNKLIDSLVANCNGEKTAIVASCDSVIGQTQDAIQAILKPAAGTVAMSAGMSTVRQKQLADASKALRKVSSELYDVKMITTKEQPKIFVQYNNKADLDKIQKALAAARRTSRYYVAPPEYINNRFPTIVKFYNHTITSDDKALLQKFAESLDLEKNDIQVKNESSNKVKDVIEIWIGTNK